jgi:hypothetical protein
MKKQLEVKIILMSLISTFFFNISVHAELDKYNQEALKKTQDFLKNKSEREAFINKSPDAQPYAQKMNDLGMNESQKNKTFNISADVFAELVKENNGDAAAVQKMLLNAQQNPEAFYNSLSPENKKMIESLGSEMEAMMSSKAPK